MLEEYFNMPIMYSLLIIVGLLWTLMFLSYLVGTLFYYILSQDKLPEANKLFNKYTLFDKITFNLFVTSDNKHLDIFDFIPILAISLFIASIVGVILDIILSFCLAHPSAALTLVATAGIFLTLRFISGKLWVNISKTKSNTKRINKLEK